MERIWVKAYPEGVPADIKTAYATIRDFFAINRAVRRFVFEKRVRFKPMRVRFGLD